MTSLAVGLDVGGTSVKLGVVDGEGRVLARDAVPTGSGSDPEALVASLARSVAGLRGQLLSDAGAVDRIGVGCAGLIDVSQGVVGLSPNLPGWRDVPLRDLLSRATGLPVTLLNDADAFALAEGTRGAGQGARSGLFITLGTGVGGALLRDGRLETGAFGMAGEVGHMTVDAWGERCPCGGRGCLEMAVGNHRLVAAARRRIASGAIADGIRSAAGGEDHEITPLVLAAAARAGDPTARAVFADAGHVIGLALAGLHNLLSLDVIVIGGGVAGAGDVLFGPVRASFEKHVMAPPEARPVIRPSTFGAEAGVVGAAVHALDPVS
jgi:glucokinase